MANNILLRTSRSVPQGNDRINPLPTLLQTPSGLALLELQGTINLPDGAVTSTDSHAGIKSQETPIGRLVFPDYESENSSSTAWMKKVYMYVGKHQRLTGEVKKLPKAVAIIRRVKDENGAQAEEDGMLEVVEIVKHKIIFSLRPEPVGTWSAEA